MSKKSDEYVKKAFPDIQVSTVKLKNDITLRVAESGKKGAPLIMMLHGWPESWFSWRHQIVALGKAGYRVCAPDLRGYGGSTAPENVADYNLYSVGTDIVNLIEHLGEQKAILVGHDWGAVLSWQIGMIFAKYFSAIICLSCPHSGWPSYKPTSLFNKLFGNNFFYISYHNEPGGLAEKEYEQNPRKFLARVYTDNSVPKDKAIITDSKRTAGGFVDRLPHPQRLPNWLSEEDFTYIVNDYENSGFRGGVNYYRNLDRNWELMSIYENHIIDVPCLFATGKDDFVINMYGGEASVKEKCKSLFRIPCEFHYIQGAGHWVQQEKPQEVSDLLLGFIKRGVHVTAKL